MALKGVNIKINGLVRAVIAAGLLHLQHELRELPAAVTGVALDASRIHKGDKVEAELRLGLLSELEGGNAGAAGLLQEGGQRLADARGVAEDAAAIPLIADQFNNLRVQDVVRGAYPGVMLDYLDRRLPAPVEGHGADGDDRGVALGTGEHQAVKLLILSGVIDTGDIDNAINAGTLAGMGAGQQGKLYAVKEAATGGEGQKAVLGAEERVVLAQAGALGFNEGGIAGVAGRDNFPGEAEVALDASWNPGALHEKK